MRLIVIFLMIAMLVVGARHLSRSGFVANTMWQLFQSLRQMPVYSTATTRGREAEFIRDSLPKRFPALLFVLAFLLLGAALWWLSR